MARLRAPAAIVALALAVWLAFGRHGFANYDALYSLLWGRQLAHGHAPDLDVSLAPTPHPLANLVGVALAPLGAAAAQHVLVALAFLTLGALGWIAYQLARTWFGPAAGMLAAALLLTREPVLSYGVRAYVDLPYLALVLGALLVEARRPRAGLPVLALLALAGLIRPEAWLFSVAYVVWLRRWELTAPAAAAPLLWALGDLALTGDALHSLTGTRANTAALERATGLGALPATLPQRVGEIVREPVLVAAAGGVVLTLACARARVRLPLVALGLATAAFALLGAAGLPVTTRYGFGVGALVTVLGAGGALGWLVLDRRDPWHRRWAAFGAVTLVLLAAFAPAQARRLDATRAAIARQQAIGDQLAALAGSAAARSFPPPVGVVNHRLVPIVALARGLDPVEVLPAPFARAPSAIWPATRAVAEAFVLDPRDPSRVVARPPRGSRPVAETRSWTLYANVP